MGNIAAKEVGTSGSLANQIAVTRHGLPFAALVKTVIKTVTKTVTKKSSDFGFREISEVWS